MKHILGFFVLFLISALMTSCFLLSSTPSSGTLEREAQEANIKKLLTREWVFQKMYREANSRVIEEREHRSLNQWMWFEENGRFRQAGMLGYTADQYVYWSLYGNTISINGSNLTYGDGNLSGSSVKYKVEHVSEGNLHLSRPDGRTQNGTTIIRHLIFTAK